MHEAVHAKRDQIADICRRHAVNRLDVFGSAAKTGNFEPRRGDADANNLTKGSVAIRPLTISSIRTLRVA